MNPVFWITPMYNWVGTENKNRIFVKDLKKKGDFQDLFVDFDAGHAQLGLLGYEDAVRHRPGLVLGRGDALVVARVGRALVLPDTERLVVVRLELGFGVLVRAREQQEQRHADHRRRRPHSSTGTLNSSARLPTWPEHPQGSSVTGTSSP